MTEPRVRAVRAVDIDDLAEIYAHEAVVAYTAQLPYREPRFWQDFYKSRDPDGVELVAEVDGHVVGHLGMILNRAPRRKHVASFGICVHPAHHGRGVGAALMAEMVHLADDWLNLLRLELRVTSDNARAIRLYERFGFVSERESRFDLFANGAYASTTHMARFHPRWADVLTAPPPQG